MRDRNRGVDATETAAYVAAVADNRAALQASVDSALSAADSIEASVPGLNTVGSVEADPESPVELGPSQKPHP